VFLEDPNIAGRAVNAQHQPLSAEDLIKLSIKIQPILYNTAKRFVKRHALINEILQDVRVSILTCTSTDAVFSPTAWLVTLTRNRAIDLANHTYRANEELVATLDECEEEVLEEFSLVNLDPARLIEADDELRVIVEAVQSLPECQRRVVVLRKIYGYSQKEIAHRLKISENTVEQHIGHASRNLSRILGRHVGYAANAPRE
jgi:RNA polymerase sigma factor (sigma-70 family)